MIVKITTKSRTTNLSQTEILIQKQTYNVRKT